MTALVTYTLTEAVDTPTEPPIEVDDFAREHGAVLNAGRRNVIVHGDLNGPARILTAGDVHVLGAVDGAGERPSRIVAGGQLSVAGAALDTELTGQRVSVGGDACRVELASDGVIDVDGALVSARVESRFLEASESHHDDLVEQIAQLRRDLLTGSRLMRQQGKRIARMARQTSTRLNLSVGQILRQQHDTLEVDLDPVYRAVGVDDEEALDHAVDKLFRQGLAGTLAQRNRAYLAGNPAREQAFAQVLQQLQSLIEAVRDRDRAQRQLRLREVERVSFLQGLADERDDFELRFGALTAGCQIDLCLVRAIATGDDTALFTPRRVTVSVEEAPKGTHSAAAYPLASALSLAAADAGVLKTSYGELTYEPCWEKEPASSLA